MHTAKLDALEEVLEETSGGVLVAYWFKHDLVRLQRAYPKAPRIDSDAVIEQWNRKKHKIALIHPASAGHGLNLQHGGHTLVFFSLVWSGEKHDQVIQRIGPARQVNTGVEAVMTHYLVARNTTDEIIMSTQDAKHKGQRTLLSAIKNYARGKGYDI